MYIVQYCFILQELCTVLFYIWGYMYIIQYYFILQELCTVLFYIWGYMYIVQYCFIFTELCTVLFYISGVMYRIVLYLRIYVQYCFIFKELFMYSIVLYCSSYVQYWFLFCIPNFVARREQSVILLVKMMFLSIATSLLTCCDAFCAVCVCEGWWGTWRTRWSAWTRRSGRSRPEIHSQSLGSG